MNFLKTSLLSGIGTVVSLITGLLTNKLIAVFIGSQGFAVIGQFRDFLNLSSSIGQLGFSSGIIKYTSELKSDEKELIKILSTSFIIQLFVSIGLSFIFILFRNEVQLLLIGSTKYTGLFVLLSLSILPMVLFSGLISVLNGLHEIKRLVKINVTTVILGAIFSLSLLYFYELEGFLIALFLNQFLFLGTTFLFLKKSSFRFSWFREGFKKPAFRKLFKFSLMTLSGAVSLSIVLIAVRKYLSVEMGLDFAGYWESMWRISTIYLSILTSSFGLYLLPTFSKLKTKYLRKEVFYVWKFTIPISLILSFGIYLFRDFGIQLIYTEEFQIIGSLFIFQLSGDALKVNSWVLGNLIVARAHVKTFMGIQIAWAAVFYLFVINLVPIYGLVGVSMAYFFTYLMHFGFMNLYFKKLLWRF